MNISQIWEENANFVLRLCNRYFRDMAVAEDVRQEVFFKIMNSKKNFKNQSSIRTWLYSISVRCCMDYFRAKRKQQYITESYATKEDACLHDIDFPVWKVNKMFKASCPISLLFVELYYEEGWSREDISQVFGFSRTIVNKKLRMGLRQMQKLL